MDIYRKALAEYVTMVTVSDPLTGGGVQLEVYRDPVSGALVGIDASFEDNVAEPWSQGVTVLSPYNVGCVLILPDDQTTHPPHNEGLTS